MIDKPIFSRWQKGNNNQVYRESSSGGKLIVFPEGRGSSTCWVWEFKSKHNSFLDKYDCMQDADAFLRRSNFMLEEDLAGEDENLYRQKIANLLGTMPDWDEIVAEIKCLQNRTRS